VSAGKYLFTIERIVVLPFTVPSTGMLGTEDEGTTIDKKLHTGKHGVTCRNFQFLLCLSNLLFPASAVPGPEIGDK
jgi:hypothetical protein